MKKIVNCFLIAVFVMAMAITTNARWLQLQGTNKWMWTNESMILTNQWIVDEGKYYYVGGDGVLLTNTTTPDGYTVNASGEWVQGNIVQYDKNSDIVYQPGATNQVAGAKSLKNNIATKQGATFADSVSLGGKTYNSDVIKMSNGSSIILQSKDFVSLSFGAGIKVVNEDTEYQLQVLVNGELDDSYDIGEEVSTINVEFDKNSTIQIIFNYETDADSLKTTEKYLYLVDGKFKK